MNFSETLSIAAEIMPHRIATLFDNDCTSYSQLDHQADLIASGLISIGVKPGDRIAFLDVNSDKQVKLIYGIARAGGISVPINYRARVSEIEFSLNDSAASVVVVGRDYRETIISIKDNINHQIKLVSFESHEFTANWIAYSEILKESSTSYPKIDSKDPAIILYTSGTTGRAKGVLLTHQSLVVNLLDNVFPDIENSEIVLLSMPLYHVAGIHVLLASIYEGRKLVIQRQFQSGEWLELIGKHKISRSTLVPTMLKMIIEDGGFKKANLDSLRMITYGAAGMPFTVITEAMKKLPQVSFINAFGQTESGSTIAALNPEDHNLSGTSLEVEKKLNRLNSIGRPLEGVEVRIYANKSNVLPGQIGEILVRSQQIMDGYWNDNTSTSSVIDDGWLHTGDMGYIDEGGYIFLQGRSTDFIKRGGERISPNEIESVLLQHPFVEEAAVIGKPDNHWGEIILAFVRKSDNSEVTEKDLISHCKNLLASFKKPQEIMFIEKMPKNSLGKVLKTDLKKLYLN
ncbi:MAG: Acyl-CoA synthetase (AMP-forming)/AMP-acid ligase II [Chloroflexi bacterium]|jgi:acyl-CoA synthetase (AMP-forming)/AMP-acid ligase II|nr:MAG: Acyl-CoA synthetase (AMP-forming)/AMP-acid ligase II [Chloroflexota bacterium]